MQTIMSEHTFAYPPDGRKRCHGPAAGLSMGEAPLSRGLACSEPVSRILS